VDFRHPLTAVVPGVQGRVLAVLAGTDAELTGRTVASLASSSPAQTLRVLNHLVHLGLVERREVPPAALFRLVEGNLVADAVLGIAHLRDRVVEHMREIADVIDPAPVSITVFGSFARGEADADSDIDVLVVRPENVDQYSEPWESSLAEWRDRVARAAGNPVEILEVGETEARRAVSGRRRGAWRDIRADGVHVVGESLDDLAASR